MTDAVPTAPCNELDARLRKRCPLTLALVALASPAGPSEEQRAVLTAHGWGEANALAAQAELREMARQPA